MHTVGVKGGAPEKCLGDLAAACEVPPAEKRAEHCAWSANGSSGLSINRPKNQKKKKSKQNLTKDYNLKQAWKSSVSLDKSAVVSFPRVLRGGWPPVPAPAMLS